MYAYETEYTLRYFTPPCYIGFMPKLKDPVYLTINNQTFTFSPQALAQFHEAPLFLAGLLKRGRVQSHVAANYVKIVARLTRQGLLAHPEMITSNVERTAVNAYWKWINETYAARVQALIRAVVNDDLRKGVSWIRRGALVAPYEGKVLPQLVPGALSLDGETRAAEFTPNTLRWVPSSAWTLHVPRRAGVPAHTDPCADCVPIELATAALEAVAVAFEDAWGHRNLTAVPAECHLFGTPPLVREAPGALLPTGKIVALVPPGALADALRQLGAVLARDPEEFAVALAEADVVVVPRAQAEADVVVVPRAQASVLQGWAPGGTT